MLFCAEFNLAFYFLERVNIVLSFTFSISLLSMTYQTLDECQKDDVMFPLDSGVQCVSDVVMTKEPTRIFFLD